MRHPFAAIVLAAIFLCSCTSTLKPYQEPLSNFQTGLKTTIDISYYHMAVLLDTSLRDKLASTDPETGRPNYPDIYETYQKQTGELASMTQVATAISIYDQKIYKLALSKEGEEFKKNSEEVGTYVKSLATTLSAISPMLPAAISSAIGVVATGVGEMGQAIIDQKNKKAILEKIRTTGPKITTLISEMENYTRSAYLNSSKILIHVLDDEANKLAYYQAQYNAQFAKDKKKLTEQGLARKASLDAQIARTSKAIIFRSLLASADPAMPLAALRTANEALVTFAKHPETAKTRNDLADAMTQFYLSAQISSTTIDRLKELQAALQTTAAQGGK